MNRPALALLLTLLPLSAPQWAQATPPVEDPRKCLFDEATPAERDMAAQVARQQGYWVDVRTKLQKTAIARCIASRGWSDASADALQKILSYEAISQEYGARLKAKGFTLESADAFLATLDADTRSIFRSNGPYYDKKARPLIESRFGREAGNAAELSELKFYLMWRSNLADALKAFAAVATTAPGTYVTDSWQILPVVEANRPVFTPRELTRDERAELREIAEKYHGRSPLHSGRLAQLKRLKELGETGDKEAMEAARDAFAAGAPRELEQDYRVVMVDTSTVDKAMKVLAALWTAHIWQRHGYDDDSRKYLRPCLGGIGAVDGYKPREVRVLLRADGTVTGVNANGVVVDDAAEACGFTLLGQNATNPRPRRSTVLQSYDHIGNRWPERDFVITGARFNPVMGDAAFLEAKFQAHLRQREAGLLFDKNGNAIYPTPSLELSRPWYEQYARDSGRLALLQDADARYSARLRAELAQARANADRKWAEAVAAYKARRNAPDSVDKLKNVAAELGLEYFGKFLALVPDWNQSPASAASGGYSSGGSGAGAQRVEVRTYDRNGSYTGSTQTSAVWADIMRSTSSPPR